MEKVVEIVKRWNSEKGTRYPVNSSDGESAIVRRINEFVSRFGIESVEKYFEVKINDSGVRDLWEQADSSKISRFVSEQKAIEEKKNEASGLNVLSILGGEIVKLMGSELASKISLEVENKINAFVEGKVLTKVVEYKGEHKKVEGIAHEQFDTILKFVAMDEPVMLVGPAGTGKNVIAKQVAESLGLNFYFSNAVTQEYKITGYGDANGEFVKTQFYDAFTKGGIFLLDEMDASCPEALVVLNSAIANRYFDFPVLGRIEAHKDFRVIACANTYGTGASMEYVGRNQLDGATLNRFALVEVDYDSRIEDTVCPNKEIANFCREFRRICLKNEVHHIVSYREMSRLYKMTEIAKMDMSVALKTCLFKGLEGDTLRMIYSEMKDCSIKESFKKVM